MQIAWHRHDADTFTRLQRCKRPHAEQRRVMIRSHGEKVMINELSIMGREHTVTTNKRC